MLGQAGLNLIITAKTSRQQAGASGRNMLNAEQLIGTGRTAVAARSRPSGGSRAAILLLLAGWRGILVADMHFFVTLCWRRRFLRLFKFCSAPDSGPGSRSGSRVAGACSSRVPRRNLPAAGLRDSRRQWIHGPDLSSRASAAFGAGELAGGSEATRSRLSMYSPCSRPARSCMRRAAT